MPISGAFFTAGDADSGPSGAALQLRRRNIYAIHRAAGKVDSNLAQSNVEGDGNEFQKISRPKPVMTGAENLD